MRRNFGLYSISSGLCRILFVVTLFATLIGCAGLLGCATSHYLGRGPASEDSIYFTTGAQKVPIYFIANTPAVSPSTDVNSSASTITDPQTFDTVVIGAGISGLVATSYLIENGAKVLTIEGDTDPLAISDNEMLVERVPSIYTSGSREIQEIIKLSGLGSSFDHQHEPNSREVGSENPTYDAYFSNSNLFTNLWDDETLKRLPAAFAVFKQELLNEYSSRYIGDLPLEESPKNRFKLELDQTDGASWIKSMPDRLRTRSDSASKAVYVRYHNESFTSEKADPTMTPFLSYANLVCRTRGGTECKNLSALFVANMLLESMGNELPSGGVNSNLVTTAFGLGKALQSLRDRMVGHANLMTARKPALLVKVTDVTSDILTVQYLYQGQLHIAHARSAIWSAPLHQAPDLIDGMAQTKDSMTKKQVKLMREITYAQQTVHRLILKGQPYHLSYATWWHPKDEASDANHFLLRNVHNADSAIEDSIVSLIQPLPMDASRSTAEEKNSATVADKAVTTWTQTFQPMFSGLVSGSPEMVAKASINLLNVRTMRAPASVPIVRPLHFTNEARYLRRHFGRVYFASPDIGSPTFGEAVFRSHCAAASVLLRVKADFSVESWSHCPVE